MRVVLDVPSTVRQFLALLDIDDPPTLLELGLPASRSHLLAVLPDVTSDMHNRVDPVEHRMHVIHAAHAVVLQRCNVLQTAEPEVIDLRIERRPGLLVCRPLAFGERHDEVVERLLRATLRGNGFHLERRRFERRDVLAPDRERRLVVAFVLRPLAHNVVDRRTETRRSRHPAAATIGDHVAASSRAIARITVAISVRGSATAALIFAISGSTRRMRSWSAQSVSWISSRCRSARG